MRDGLRLLHDRDDGTRAQPDRWGNLRPGLSRQRRPATPRRTGRAAAEGEPDRVQRKSGTRFRRSGRRARRRVPQGAGRARGHRHGAQEPRPRHRRRLRPARGAGAARGARGPGMTGRVGQVLEIAFPPFTPRITFLSDRELTVQIVSGHNAGFTDTVEYEAVEVRDGLVMLTWQEHIGSTIVHVLVLTACT